MREQNRTNFLRRLKIVMIPEFKQFIKDYDCKRHKKNKLKK